MVGLWGGDARQRRVGLRTNRDSSTASEVAQVAQVAHPPELLARKEAGAVTTQCQDRSRARICFTGRIGRVNGRDSSGMRRAQGQSAEHGRGMVELLKGKRGESTPQAKYPVLSRIR